MPYQPYRGPSPSMGGGEDMMALMRFLMSNQGNGAGGDQAAAAPMGTSFNAVTNQMSAPGADPFAQFTGGYRANDLLAAAGSPKTDSTY